MVPCFKAKSSRNIRKAGGGLDGTFRRNFISVSQNSSRLDKNRLISFVSYDNRGSYRSIAAPGKAGSKGAANTSLQHKTPKQDHVEINRGAMRASGNHA